VQQSATETDIAIDDGTVRLPAILGIPADPHGVVLFAHGSGSGRLSPRNQAVAQALQNAGFITLLADLLTTDEARDSRRVFDIPLLTSRLLACTHWVRTADATATLPIGYFGASTGAGAALAAAAGAGDQVGAIVSRGGRPDLAAPYLRDVRAPTLLIVGGNDIPVIDLNRHALAQISGEKEMVIVPGATHLFEEPGAMEQVAALARDWFQTHAYAQ